VKRAWTLAACMADPEYAKQWHYFGDKACMRVPGARSAATGAGYDFISDSGNARGNNGRDSNPADQGDWDAANECGQNEAAHNSPWHGTHGADTIQSTVVNTAVDLPTKASTSNLGAALSCSATSLPAGLAIAAPLAH